MGTVDLAAIVAALETKGVKYELTGECSRVEWIDGRAYNAYTSFYGVDLGIAIASGVWAWYSIYLDYDTCEAKGITFKQRYNANVGKVLKSWATGRKVAAKIKALTDLDMYALEMN